MLNKESLYLIEIIKNVLHNKKTTLLDDINYESLYKIASFHSLECFLAVGLKDYDLGNVSKTLKSKHDEAIFKVAFQEAEKENLLNVLEENKIKHMPLKGSILKYLYPSIELRSMADFDCYFDKKYKKEVKKLMIDLGYTVESYNKGNHDVYFKKPFMNIEMHKDLVNECYKISDYYKTINQKLIKVASKEYEYKFSNEDFYIFMIAHMAKHFAHGGTGVRSFIDVYLFLEKYQDLNFNYINTELDKMGLTKFSKGSIDLAYFWFDDKKEYPNTDLLDNFQENVLTNGTYGTVTNSAIVQFYEDNSDDVRHTKSKYLFRRIFPSFNTMKGRNPILKKVPILLPWFYLTRLFKGLFGIKSHKGELTSVNNITKNDILKLNKLHDELGVKNKL